MEIRILHIDEKEVHEIGDLVSVCWNTQEVQDVEQYTEPDGTEVTKKKTRHVRTGKPYILFCDIRDGDDGKPYIDDDSPVDGGIGASTARRLVEQTNRAIIYLENLE